MTEEDDLDDLLDDDLDIDLLSRVEYEQVDQLKKPSATHHVIDTANLATYVYPTNLEVRDYQYNIVNRAIFDNVLVALPTGLGKTFIASTVMLNFLRWFPQLKIIFMAPTKPLVAQQIKACCGITGIPTSKVAILLDKTRKNREAIWDEKQVFFTTPQVVENDLARGIVNPKHVVLLVIDEAHRAKGNYAYNNVVKFLNRFNLSFRILALTATPASDVEGVQEIVDNLCISKVEVRTEKSIDIIKYSKRKRIERITVGQSPEIIEAVEMICEAIAPVLEIANQRKIYEITDPAKINAFAALDAQQKLTRNPNIPEGLKWANYFILQLLVVVGQCLRRLNIYGIRSFYKYFHEKFLEFSTKYNNKKSTNHMAAKFYFHKCITELLEKCENNMKDADFLGHQKLEVLIFELTSFFENSEHLDSRVIVFTEFRESALDIVRALERQGTNLKPHIFIGQAKEKEKFDEKKYLKKGKKSKVKESDIAPWDNNEPGRPCSSSEHAQINGMNQKMQKELIKRFKEGEYNILVATSIGEEGLDIGEVDLIVCYDSTSSPIKNVQRMGRTGRNRNGKVILLFSSNEELKFDKAMSGYEYIQQHIMNGNMISLHEQNRILPFDAKPVAEEKFIDLPEENEVIKAEDDEDEIIKIATKYMTQKVKDTKPRNSSAMAKLKVPPLNASSVQKTKSKAAKSRKQFFMPDNVPQGFTPVSAMLKRKGDDESLREKKLRITDGKRDPHTPDVLDTILNSDSDQDLIKLTVDEAKIRETVGDTSNNRHISMRQCGKPKEDTTPVVQGAFEAKFNFEQVGTSFDISHASFQIKEDSRTAQPDNSKQSQNEILKETGDDSFDDDDDEILALVSTSSFNAESTTEQTNKQVLPSENEALSSTFTSDEGFLTEQENLDLYMSYYVPTDGSTLANCYNPLLLKQSCGVIGHSRVSWALLLSLDCMKDIATKKWEKFTEKFEKGEPLEPLSDKFIEF